MTVPTFFLTLVGLLLVVFGFLGGANLPIVALGVVALGVVALIAAGVLEVLGRRQACASAPSKALLTSLQESPQRG